MKVKLKVECPACKFQNEVRILRPTRFRMARFMYTCADCGCVINATARHPKGDEVAPPGSVTVNSSIARASQELLEHLKANSEDAPG